MRLVWRWLPVVFIGVAAAPCAASGQTKAAVAEGSGNEAEAAKLYDAGAAAQKEGDWKTACEEYAKAYALFQHSQILISLGVAEYRAGKYRAAVEHLSRFLGTPPVGLPHGKRAEYEKYLADAKGRLGVLKIFAEVGAVVTVNGEPAGMMPATGTLDVLVDPGRFAVAAVLGRREGKREVPVGAGESPEVRLTLLEPPPPVAGVSRPAERGREQGGPTAGKPPPSDAFRTGVLVGGATLTVTGAVIGGVSLHVASQNAAVATDNRESAQGPHARREADFKNVAFWSLLGGGAAGGGALLYYLLAEPKSPPQIRVGGVAGPGGGVVVVSGEL